MEKKLRLMGIMLAAAMTLSACQPTPEAEPVIQKDTEKLIEMAVGVSDAQAGEQKTTLAERFGERFTVDYTTTTSGVRVVGDVKIKYLAESTFPMYRVKNAKLPVEIGTALAKRLLGTEELYVKKEFMTREQIAERINQIVSFMGDEENKKRYIRETGDEEEGKKQYEELYQRKKEELAELQKQYNELTSDEAPAFALWDGQWDNEQNAYSLTWDCLMLVAHDQDYGDTPRITVTSNDEWEGGFDFSYYRSEEEFWGEGYHVLEIPEDWSVPCEGTDMTPQEAVNKALTVFAGIMDVYPTEVWWCDNASDTGRATKRAYVVRLSRKYEDAGCVFTRVDNSPKERISDALQGSDLYAYSWKHEIITVAVNEEGILDLWWQWPVEVLEELTEEVNLLDFDTIYHLFTQQMNRYLATEPEGTEIKLFGVTLGLMCIREQDSLETGLIVPVWYFRGYTVAGQFAEKEEWRGILHGDSSPICVLNAIDGSVIDTSVGY